jgi:hypothetical protein
MKKLRPMLSALLGMITSTLILRLMGLHYHLFTDPFDLGKAAQQCGIVVLCVLLWFLIILPPSSLRKKG